MLFKIKFLILYYVYIKILWIINKYLFLTDTEEKGNINNKKNKILHTVYSKLKIIEYDKLTTRKEAFKKL
jgi:hypothetical protein